MSLVRKFLLGIVAVAIGWFIIIFFYMDGLARQLFSVPPHPLTHNSNSHHNHNAAIPQHRGRHHSIIEKAQHHHHGSETARDSGVDQLSKNGRGGKSVIDLSSATHIKSLPPRKTNPETKSPFSIKHRFRREQFNVSNVFIYKQYTLRPSKIDEVSENKTEASAFSTSQNGDGHVIKDGGGHVTENVAKYGNLTADEKEDIAHGDNRHSFNVSASYLIPLNRTVPDFRPDQCPQQFVTTPLRVSVIICFHNEAWSTLLRTLWSVLNTAPPSMLKQVILIDDASTYDYLGSKLERVVSNLDQVELHRTKQREGLVRSRLLGVSLATGDILVFLDSHCECGHQWLEPLVHAIREDRKQIVCPEVDIINDQTFEYEPAPGHLHGGFLWDLQFAWKQLPNDENVRRTSDSDPIRSPTMVGGLFAVDKDYFLRLGSYDPHLDIWGGENLELSFRVWSCGGRITILPCSRVGHVFRRTIPYDFPDGARATLRHNALRVAETWLGPYRKFYYSATAQQRSESEAINVDDRLQLSKNLHCHDFSWYLRNIVPEMPVPRRDAVYFGQVHFHTQCLESTGSVTGSVLSLDQCITQHPDQTFTITTSGLFVHREFCVDERLELTKCNQVNGKWTLSKHNQLQFSDVTKSITLCVSGRDLAMVPCSVKENEDQTWRFTHHFDQDILAQFKQ